MSLSPRNPALKYQHSRERKQVVSHLRGKKPWESVGEEEGERESCPEEVEVELLAEVFLELLDVRAHQGGKL